jgi:hypothetical protein
MTCLRLVGKTASRWGGNDRIVEDFSKGRDQPLSAPKLLYKKKGFSEWDRLQTWP